MRQPTAGPTRRGPDLATMEMTRTHETNVEVPGAVHAPTERIIRRRVHPPIGDHGAATPTERAGGAYGDDTPWGSS